MEPGCEKRDAGCVDARGHRAAPGSGVGLGWLGGRRCRGWCEVWWHGAGALAGSPSRRWGNDVGGGGEVGRRGTGDGGRGTGRVGRETREAARPRAARTWGAAGPDRRARRGAVRESSGHGRSARDRAAQRARPRGAGPLRAGGTGASARHLRPPRGIPCRVARRVPRHFPRTWSAGPGCDRGGARGLRVAARASGPRDARRPHVPAARGGPLAPAGGGAARVSRSHRAAAAVRRSLGGAVGGRVALRRGGSGCGLGGKGGREAAACSAARRARARGHAAHGADHRVRVRHCRTDRRAREPRGHPARGGRGARTRAGAALLVARAAARAPAGGGVGARARATRPGGARRGCRAGWTRRDGGRVACGGCLARGRGGRVVAMELAAPPVAVRRADRLCCDGLRLNVRSQRLPPRRL